MAVTPFEQKQMEHNASGVYVRLPHQNTRQAKLKAQMDIYPQHTNIAQGNLHNPLVKSSAEMIPAIPPEDYKGSQADWMVKLQERGLWDGKGWHGDIEIPTDDWWGILEECEGDE